MRQLWERFIAGQPPGGPLSGVVLESWERCRSFSVDAARVSLQRLPYPEVRARLDRSAALIKAGAPHLHWALASMAPLSPVVIMLTDADGVIVESVGNAPEVMTRFGLIPGYDWSERSMGTNGIGTALAFGAPVAVLGPEHYKEAWHNNTCVGAPVKSAEGKIFGAVDISTSAADGDPARVVLVSFLADVIARELASQQGGDVPPPAFVDEGVLARATADGSSASREVLVKHARELEGLSEGLLEVAHAAPVATESLRVDELVRRVVEPLRGVSTQLASVQTRSVSGSRERLERALGHLIALAQRRSPEGVRVTAEAKGEQVELRIEPVAPKPTAPGGWTVEQTGLVLGRWLATELLRSVGGTLTTGGAGDCVRLPAAP